MNWRQKENRALCWRTWTSLFLVWFDCEDGDRYTESSLLRGVRRIEEFVYFQDSQQLDWRNIGEQPLCYSSCEWSQWTWRSTVASFAVWCAILHIMAPAQDYTRVIGAIQITRGLPNVPQMASFFQHITRNPALRFRQWFCQDMEFIGLSFLAAHRPQYIHSAVTSWVRWCFTSWEMRTERRLVSWDLLLNSQTLLRFQLSALQILHT